MMRIGQGFDVHALVLGRPLILGGVTIPHTHGLQGHSDADALLHAIIDALLGAAGLGDIGQHFPDTDPQFKGADSRQLLRHVWHTITGLGWQLGNLDATIIAQAPKMMPHLPQMVTLIAEDLQVSPSQINLKAKTCEKLGFIGRQEGIATEAVVLLCRST